MRQLQCLLQSESKARAQPYDLSVALCFHKRNDNFARVQEASRLFGLAYEADRDSGRTVLLWALLEKRRGNLDKARKIFEKGMHLLKHDPIIYQVFPEFDSAQLPSQCNLVCELWSRTGELYACRPKTWCTLHKNSMQGKNLWWGRIQSEPRGFGMQFLANKSYYTCEDILRTTWISVHHLCQKHTFIE